MTRVTRTALPFLFSLSATLVQAQPTPTPHPPTIADLQTRIAVLQAENDNLKRDNGILIAACQQPAPAPPAAEPTAADRMAKTAADRQQQELDDASWFVKDPTFAITETNRVFQRYAWKATLHNSIPRPQHYDVIVQFVDAQGIILDTARLYNQAIRAGDEIQLSGEHLVRIADALRVASVRILAPRKPEGR